MKTLISVDPGKNGAIAWFFGTEACGVERMPETRRAVITLIKTLVVKPEDCVAYMEKVSSFIPDGGASMMFEYGRAVERPGCILECLGVRTIEIMPKKWQAELGLGSSDRIPGPRMPKNLIDKNAEKLWKYDHAEEIRSAKAHNDRAKREWKNKLKEEAERRFPRLNNITLQTCDALLLLDVAAKLEGEILI